MQDELITYYSRNQTPFQQAKAKCAEHFRAAFGLASPLANVIIMDCAPGSSNATAAALKLANKVIVPFRPDTAPKFAVDQISQIVEGCNFDDVMAMLPAEQRHICLANYIRPGSRDAIYVDTITGNLPMLSAQIPAMSDVAGSFDYLR